MSSLTEEQTERCRKVFEKFDTNNDGVIELSELKKGLMELGNFSDEDVLEIMGEADSDKNGVIDEKEFREYASEVFIKVKEDVREDKITALFLKYDHDNDGLVGPDEVFCITQDLSLTIDVSMSDAEGIVRTVDTDNDGKITLDELKSFLCR